MKIDFAQIITAEAKAETALAEARLRATARLSEWADATAASITGVVPMVEQLSWGTKDLAARAMLAGTASAADRTLIEAEAAVTGADPVALARRIVGNADAYRAIVARLTAIRVDAVRRIGAAQTAEAVESIAAGAIASWSAA